MPNPFAYGSRITDPTRFVGRTAELRRVFGTLDTAHTGQLQSVSVVGPRRIGKSSLLYHIYQTYPSRITNPNHYIFAYAEMKSGQYSTLDGLLKGLLAALHASTPKAHTKLLRVLEKGANDPTLTLAEFETAFKAFQTADTPLYPILCLDEFENLTDHPTVFPDTLYDSLRSLMNASQLALVIASATPLHDIKAQSEKLTSPFFNIFSDFIELGDLTELEAWDLIKWGKKCDRPFSDEDCTQALKLAGTHPLKIQLAGKLVYEAKASPEMDWKSVQKDFERTTKQIFSSRKAPQTRWEKFSHFVFFRIPHALGHVTFLLSKSPTDNAKNNQLMGAILLMVLLPAVIAISWFGYMPLFISLLALFIVTRLFKS